MSAPSVPPVVLLLVTTFDIGGAERVYIELARGLAGRGFRVLAACLQARSGAVARELEGHGVTIVDLRMSGKADLLVLLRLVRLLRREKVDAVYTFLIHSHAIGRLAARLAGVPVILSSQQVMSWEARTSEWLNRITARWCTAIVGVSRNVERYLAEDVGIPREKLVVIYNCVDVNRFVYQPHERQLGQAPVIGCIQRLNAEKDQASLLRAFVTIRHRYPGAELLLAGAGPERDRLERLAATLHIAGAVSFLGHVDDVRQVHRRLDVYVQSSHVEGLPVAVLEALAAGLPVVAARVGGNEEAVLHGVGGLLVPPRSPDALASAIIQFLDDPAEARRMGREGRQHVIDLFGTEAMVTATEALLRRTLQAAEQVQA